MSQRDFVSAEEGAVVDDAIGYAGAQPTDRFDAEQPEVDQ